MVKKEEKKPVKAKYYEALGRRKTAIARVRLMSGSGRVTVNDKELKEYFREPGLGQAVLSPIENLKLGAKFDVKVKVRGGGIHAQSEAVRHGLARALTEFNAEFKKRLRNLGFLTRDPRMVERKKYGLKKARRAPQWQKR
ncbi:MAG: 30S ribosomal protein S9 [Candidatus Liptonbacteria bacterium]|nr:30S ribosomal protein S9 [Candidatus Liptonbacteria bacterium]